MLSRATWRVAYWVDRLQLSASDFRRRNLFGRGHRQGRSSAPPFVRRGEPKQQHNRCDCPEHACAADPVGLALRWFGAGVGALVARALAAQQFAQLPLVVVGVVKLTLLASVGLLGAGAVVRRLARRAALSQ